MITLILIGGRSRRMGCDKWRLIRPDGIDQLSHLTGLARLHGDEVVFSIRGDEALPAGVTLLPDPLPDRGPLGALAAFHHAFPGQAVQVFGCDLFLLDAATVRELRQGRDPAAKATAFPNRLDGRPEPLATIYEPAALAEAAGAVGRGERRLRRFLETLQPRMLPLRHPVALDNANTPQELAECFAKLREGITEKTLTVTVRPADRAPRPLTTFACTAGGLYAELRFLERLPDFTEMVPSLNGTSCGWDAALHPGDTLDLKWREPRMDADEHG